jgi:[glutamine synthetase] adenylyltransferase / [glutamine synthetase]-adenylyl-L-tyrosine phosphorylase
MYMNKRNDFDKFENPARAEKLLLELIAPLIGAVGDGSDKVAPHLIADTFAGAILDSSDPDRALINIHRLAEVSFGSAFLRDLFSQPVLLDTAITLCSSSQYLSDILVRNPAWFRWITASDVLMKSKSYDDLYIELKNQVRTYERTAARYNAVRRFHRREMLRIGARDLLGEAGLEETIGDLSNLAECVSSVFFELVYDELAHKHGCRPDVPCSVIGLGKLGGNELNYSSDIDVFFVIGEDKAYRTAGGKTINAVEFYYELADRWIRGLTEHTTEGKLYRVDTRLRPDGEAGPLIRSVLGYLTYYETRGELWERQMLIKARAIAGDKKFGEDFIGKLEPFIYPVTLFESPKETIARMKHRIERQSGEELNVKLSRGGIRDIEFIVQALQLINGGRMVELRNGSTLEGIHLLEKNGLLSSVEASHLLTVYRFLRTLEHRLQMEFNTQIHVLPAGEKAQRSIALGMGYGSREQFITELDGHLSVVQSIFDEVFGDQVSGTPVEAFFNGEVTRTAADLGKYGFRDVRKAAELLHHMALGISPVGIGDSDRRTRTLFRDSVRDLLVTISETISPDRALKNLLLLLQSYPHPPSFYDAMKKDALRRAVINVCAFSDRLVMNLSRNPGYLEFFITQTPLVLESTLSEDNPEENMRITTVHIKYLTGRITLPELHADITEIARIRLRELWQEICIEKGYNNPPMTILTLGKFSGSELGPGGDVDVIYLYEKTDHFDSSQAEEFARFFIKKSADEYRGEPGYEVDARLRPEGQSAPLAVSFDSYKEYLKIRASLWERQSLIKVRFLAGNERLAQEALGYIEEFIYDSPLSDGWIGETREMRKKTITRSRVRRSGFIDIKFGAGGIMDIEFLIQMMQLYFGRYNRTIRIPNTLLTLQRLTQAGYLHKTAGEVCENAYLRYRAVEYFNMMYLDNPTKLIPTGREEQETLRRFLHLEEEVGAYFSMLQKRVRDVFDTETERLAAMYRANI